MEKTKLQLSRQLLAVCILWLGTTVLMAKQRQQPSESKPPTVNCTANPFTVDPGGFATITARAVSSQNRPLTYGYSASSGKVTGSTSSAMFDATGVPPGPVTVTCNVADDLGRRTSDITRLIVTRGD